MFDIIKSRISKTVPFARHAGVELTSVGDGIATAKLNQTKVSVNHIGSQHAGALFTLGETVSGGDLAGALAPIILKVKPIASGARINYIKLAKGLIEATATTSLSYSDLLSQLESEGYVNFSVNVEMTNTEGLKVADMIVDWNVKMKPSS